jgi:hypothetical protein
VRLYVAWVRVVVVWANMIVHPSVQVARRQGCWNMVAEPGKQSDSEAGKAVVAHNQDKFPRRAEQYIQVAVGKLYRVVYRLPPRMDNWVMGSLAVEQPAGMIAMIAQKSLLLAQTR